MLKQIINTKLEGQRITEWLESIGEFNKYELAKIKRTDMDSPYSLIDKYDNRIGDWYYSITFLNEFTCKAIKDNGIRASTEYSINLITGDVNKGNDIDRSSVNEDQNDIAKMKAELTSSNNFELSIENKVSEPIAELSNTQIKTTQTPNKSFEDKEVQKETGFFRKIIDLITK